MLLTIELGRINGEFADMRLRALTLDTICVRTFATVDNWCATLLAKAVIGAASYQCCVSFSDP